MAAVAARRTVVAASPVSCRRTRGSGTMTRRQSLVRLGAARPGLRLRAGRRAGLPLHAAPRLGLQLQPAAAGGRPLLRPDGRPPLPSVLPERQARDARSEGRGAALRALRGA